MTPTTHPPEVALRPATPDDRDLVLDVCRTTMSEAHRSARGWDNEQIEAAILETLHLESTQIVELAGDPVGVLTVVSGPRGDAITRICLLPRAQSQGIGTFLLRSLQEQNSVSGRPLRLSVYKANPAWRLYHRLGFRVVRETAIEYHMVWQPQLG